MSLLWWWTLLVAVATAEAGCGCVIVYPAATCSDPTLVVVPRCVSRNSTQLSLRHNLVSVSADTLGRFKSLSSLTVAHRPLDYVAEDAFHGNRYLRHLTVYNTSLEHLTPEVFRHTPYLQELALFSNRLVYLPVDTFRHLSSVRTIDLHDNRLVTASLQLFSSTNATLVSLNLDQNPLICDCQLVQLYTQLSEKGVSLSGKATCWFPVELRGELLQDLATFIQCN